MWPDRNVMNSLLVAAVLATMLTTAWAQPRGRWSFSADNVPGWVLMTPTERTEHADRMQAMKTYEECRAYIAQHRVTLETRAKAQGKMLRAPRFDACDQMKAKGYFK